MELLLAIKLSLIKGVARIFGKGSAMWSKATDSHRAIICAENFQDFMLILDPESTCKWHCNKKPNSQCHSGYKNEQQADFEV